MKFKPLTAGADATVYILGMLCLVFEYLQYCMHTKHRNQLFCTVLYCTVLYNVHFSILYPYINTSAKTIEEG